MFLKNAKFVLDNLSKSSELIFNSKHSTNFFIDHDPEKPSTITSSMRRQYLNSLGPHQPKFAKYPINKDIDSTKQRNFNPNGFKELLILEYTLMIDSTYYFICSLFPKGPGRELSNTAWVVQGVNS